MAQPNDGILRDAQSHRLVWITCESCGERALVRADGHRRFCSRSCAKTREHHPAWKGDQASYLAKHERLYRMRGKADHCSQCGLVDPAVRYEWANLTGNYDDVNDYAPMCKVCHVIYDGQFGASRYCAKLTPELVAQIRERYANGEQIKPMAREFGVHHSTIRAIVRRRSWKSVP